ncbi:TPA: hypothetical protein JBL19_11230 [Legionella pneumophila]|uniref:Uncharacterized protein n=2 Tax=Legionella TaxID=445 RepID=A0A378PLT0_9GAMM|nr:MULTISPECIES: SIR2 family protein [Legionella]KTD70633.1 hypothetical protein Lstg_3118 [Legionella steigerwaltii]MBN9228734.1 SIR2 family protein [Legionella steelei]MCL9684034.1 SIR2 family protein [Legionella maioricensis]MCL9687059.1 SIR2 family protein [Legionella maioricensis]OJW08390.1 MAG: hypothetical protein BGO44_04560 [Legionella sp. 39-23]
MESQINIEYIYDKNINILLGAGASYGLFPTLELMLEGENGNRFTIETLAEKFESQNQPKLKTLLFMYYFKSCIKPVLEFCIHNLETSKQNVILQYSNFIHTILSILYKRTSPKRRCNIFTTNYDGCIALSSEEILKQGQRDFILNDGTRGFRKKYLQAKNFNTFLCQTGIFEKNYIDVPQINLIHLHGSAYWQKEDDRIIVDYQSSGKFSEIGQIVTQMSPLLDQFTDIISSDKSEFSSLNSMRLDDLSYDLEQQFWQEYKKIPIVNPEKWKFHETVFEEHYYQMLRALSYELEKDHTILISFGFSFADEHILNLIKRSLSNHLLQLFVCCFNDQEKKNLEKKFLGYKNIQFISCKENLNFEIFNTNVFTLEPNNPERQ